MTERFEFGKNWQRFLEKLDDDRIHEAERALTTTFGSLEGKTFLDIGSGSGLHSLAARRLGARVHSIDYDTQSVACTRELKRRYFPDDQSWIVEQGSALDRDYLTRLGQFDIVYSWGVLHHTGAMWQALDFARIPVKPDGLLFVSIYDDVGIEARIWKVVKYLYNRLPRFLRFLIIVPSFIRIWGPQMVRDGLRGNPMRTWNARRKIRGMSAWHDLIDWVGGYPYEFAKPSQIFEFYGSRGMKLEGFVAKGCNDYLFRNVDALKDAV
jgi:2-polyprenyl-6-hydroxyphenyl methylase/3-demethylubiquinone-9 3-methyltransferase